MRTTSCTHATRGLSPAGLDLASPLVAASAEGFFHVVTDRPDRKPTDMSEQDTSVTGAQSLIRSLEAAGTDDIFGIPGGAILPAYDPLMDSTIRHILVRHEQGAGHAAQGYAAATGRVGVCMATSRSGRDQPGHADRRRPHGLGPDRRRHRPGRRRVDRHRRLPGGRHPRHHDADHQAQLPGHRPRRDPAHRSPRRSTSPRPAAPARCSSTSRSPRCRRRRRSPGRPSCTCPATAR